MSVMPIPMSMLMPRCRYRDSQIPKNQQPLRNLGIGSAIDILIQNLWQPISWTPAALLGKKWQRCSDKLFEILKISILQNPSRKTSVLESVF